MGGVQNNTFKSVINITFAFFCHTCKKTANFNVTHNISNSGVSQCYQTINEILTDTYDYTRLYSQNNKLM